MDRLHDLIEGLMYDDGLEWEGYEKGWNDALSEVQSLVKQHPGSGWLPIGSCPKNGSLVLFDMDSFGVCPGYYSENGWGDDSYSLKYTWVFYDHLDGRGWNALKDDAPPKAWIPLPSNTPPQPKDCEQQPQSQQGGCEGELLNECWKMLNSIINSDMSAPYDAYTPLIQRDKANALFQRVSHYLDTTTTEEAG